MDLRSKLSESQNCNICCKEGKQDFHGVLIIDKFLCSFHANLSPIQVVMHISEFCSKGTPFPLRKLDFASTIWILYPPLLFLTPSLTNKKANLAWVSSHQNRSHCILKLARIKILKLWFYYSSLDNRYVLVFGYQLNRK